MADGFGFTMLPELRYALHRATTTTRPIAVIFVVLDSPNLILSLLHGQIFIKGSVGS